MGKPIDYENMLVVRVASCELRVTLRVASCELQVDMRVANNFAF